MKKMIHVLLTKKDEEIFSSEIKKVFPATLFIDNMVWNTESPPAKASIINCNSNLVYIWNTEIYPNITGILRTDGKFQGPQSGMVIQLLRTSYKENTLLSGWLSVGVAEEDSKMKDFVKKVWKILKKVASSKVIAVNPETAQVIDDKIIMLAVGENAAEWSKADSKRFLQFNNDVHCFMKAV